MGACNVRPPLHVLTLIFILRSPEVRHFHQNNQVLPDSLCLCSSYQVRGQGVLSTIVSKGISQDVKTQTWCSSLSRVKHVVDRAIMDKLLPLSKRLAWKVHLCRQMDEERDGFILCLELLQHQYFMRICIQMDPSLVQDLRVPFRFACKCASLFFGFWLIVFYHYMYTYYARSFCNNIQYHAIFYEDLYPDGLPKRGVWYRIWGYHLCIYTKWYPQILHVEDRQVDIKYNVN